MVAEIILNKYIIWSILSNSTLNANCIYSPSLQEDISEVFQWNNLSTFHLSWLSFYLRLVSHAKSSKMAIARVQIFWEI